MTGLRRNDALHPAEEPRGILGPVLAVLFRLMDLLATTRGPKAVRAGLS